MKVKRIISFILLSFLLVLTSCFNDKECIHESTTWIIDKEASCIEVGLHHEECTKCHKKIGEEIVEALGHIFENDECIKCSKKTSLGLEYKLDKDNESYSVVGLGTCTDSDIVIGKIYEDLPVTSIGEKAFEGCSNISFITILNNVTIIGNHAFCGCSSLTSIELPNSISSIGLSIFEGCKNLKFNEFDNGYYLGNSDNPYLLLFKIKENNVESFTINQNTLIIYDYVFLNCTSLVNVYYNGNLNNWYNVKFCNVFSDPLYYQINFYIKNEQNNFEKTSIITDWHYLENHNINYTYFPKYISEEHVKRLLEKNKKLADAGQKDSLGNIIPNIEESTRKYVEARKNNDKENMNKYKEGWEAYSKWLDVWYQLYSFEDSEEAQKLGYSFYEFKVSTYELMPMLVIDRLQRWLYEWCGYTLDDLKEDNDQFNVTNEYISNIVIDCE